MQSFGIRPRALIIILMLAMVILLKGGVLRAREEGIHAVPLILPSSLEAQRGEIEAALVGAQRRLAAFADRYGWHDQVEKSFLVSAKIYDDKALFDASLRQLFGMQASAKIPATYVAAVKEGVLVAISPALYARIYPDGSESLGYEKLLCHELVHELHIRILNYDEDAMGPVWFYEGFAIYGSGQFEDSLPEISDKEIWGIVRSTKRQSYKKYATVIRYFLKRATLQELVIHAGKKDFNQWLQSLGCEKQALFMSRDRVIFFACRPALR
jgi:hypothetical protein